jgi:rare lipoprotein A
MRFTVDGNMSKLQCFQGRSSSFFRIPFMFLSVAALAGCAGSPSAQRYALNRELGAIDPRYGVRPSPRVVEDGEDVPLGGGRYQVGKAYKIAGKTYVPTEKPHSAVGTASWYGSDFHGRRTANGEVFDRNSFSAAHPTMPLPSYARVTNLGNSHSMIVRVNDRGPYHGGRVMDVSQRVAEALDFHRIGTARVKVEWLGRADLSGSDSATLLASLRTDGTPATLPGMEAPVMVAEDAAPARSRVAYVEPPRRPADLDDDREAAAPAAGPVAEAAPPMPPAPETTEANAARSGKAAAEEIMNKTASAEADQGVDETPAKPIHSGRAILPPLPPTRPSSLGSASAKSASRQAMN